MQAKLKKMKLILQTVLTHLTYTTTPCHMGEHTKLVYQPQRAANRDAWKIRSKKNYNFTTIYLLLGWLTFRNVL